MLFFVIIGDLGSGAPLRQHIHGLATAALSTAASAPVSSPTAATPRGTLAGTAVIITVHIRTDAKVSGRGKCGWALRI